MTAKPASATSIIRRTTLLLGIATALHGGPLQAATTNEAPAAGLDEVHFLIPAGPGGGWDGTARGIGEALRRSGLAAQVSYENLSGGGGGRAIARLIETAPRQHNTLLVNSTPIVIRSLQRVFPQSFRDLTPLASVIADYSCFLVLPDAPWQDWRSLADAFIADPRAIKIAGGSVRGSTDHLVVARALQTAGADPRRTIYVAYDGGGKALAGVLSGETQLLSTGCGEALDMVQAQRLRVLGVTAGHRLEALPAAATLREQGFDLVFANWRGFFAAPGIAPAQRRRIIKTLEALLATDAFKTVRTRHGWEVRFIADDDFTRFLVDQETAIGGMMRELGFLR